MEDGSIDLLDRRGRLIALVIAGVIGLAASLGLLLVINSAGVHKNDDAISRITPVLLGMGFFAVISSAAFKIVIAIRKKRAGN